MNDAIEILKRKIARDKNARQQAERLMEDKAMELFNVNEKLKELNKFLEQQVLDRTHALRLSEEKYRGIIENMDLGLIEVDKKDTIQRVYNRFTWLTGYTEQDLLGKKAADVLIPDEAFQRLIAEQNANRLEGKSGVYEVPMRKKNGELIWVIVSGAPMVDGNGNVYGSIGIHLDITERKKTQEALEAARQVAENARHAEKIFLANISHEIRTPINAILGMTHLLYDTGLNEKQSEYLSAILYSADLLLHLVSDVLDISKIEAGEMHLSESVFSLKDLINSILQTFRLRLEGKQITLVFEYDDDIENDVIGDETFLTQILMNLLANAVKFTEKGQIGVQVSLLCRLGDFVMTEFKVFDTGIGIAAKNLNQVFDSFKQANADVKIKYGGTGLGLSIVKQLVNLHGGEITVESEENIGTTFSFTLPLKDSGSKTTKLQALAIDNTDDWKNCHILIVEDNLINQKYVEGLLSRWQLQYKTAQNGKEAIDLVQKYTFDLILMDIRMPEMNGYDATKNIRNMKKNPNQHIPIIALTASALSDEIDYAYEIGMSAYLTKPYTPEQLSTILRQKLPLKPDDSFVKSSDSNQKKQIDSGLAPDYLEKIYDNDTKYAADMFALFLKTVPNQFYELTPLYNSKDKEAFQKLAHQIKPSFTMVALPEITKNLQVLEKMEAIDSKQFSDLFEETKQIFETKIGLVEHAYKTLLDTLQG